MGFQGWLKNMMVKEENDERLKMEVGYRIRMEEPVVFLNLSEEKGVWLKLATAEDCLSLPVENWNLEEECLLMELGSKVEEVLNREVEATVLSQRVVALISQPVEKE